MSQFKTIIENILKQHNIILNEAKVIKISFDELGNDSGYSYEDIITYHMPSYLPIYKNPTKSEFFDIYNHSIEKDIRGLIVNNDIYIWDSYWALHNNIWQLLNIDPNINTCAFLYHDNKLEFGDILNKDGMYIKDINLAKSIMLNNKWFVDTFGKNLINNALPHHTWEFEEDTIKQGNSWVNKGKEGTHGIFKTKKQADNQRKAMFANGYKG